MKNITIREAAAAVHGTLHGESGTEDKSICGIAIDNRKIEKGWLFVPIKGERFDGHSFIDAAFDAGAVCTLSEKDLSRTPYIKVSDTQQAFRDLAEYYRSLFSIRAIGITGSVGKTTTKEMVASVIKQCFNTLYTEGNLNNQTGVPLTVLKLEPWHEAAVIEMGTNHFGEIAAVAKVVRPDYCIFTNIGEAHLEFLGSKEGILKAKTEMIDFMNPGGKVIINGDDEYLKTLKSKRDDVISFGFEKENDIFISEYSDMGLKGSSFTAETPEGKITAAVHAPGKHMVYNSLAGIAAGLCCGMKCEDIAKGIEEYRAMSGRLNIIDADGYTVIDDVYNASPSAMRSSLDVLSDAGGRRVCILGDMLELGENSENKHLEIGRYAADKDIDVIIAVGNEAKNICRGAEECGRNALHFDTQDDMLKELSGIVEPGDTILVKASRGMHLEKTVGHLVNGEE